jgi:hypothetical protein
MILLRCWMTHFWCSEMSSSFSSSQLMSTQVFELLLTWQSALIWLSMAARTVGSDKASGRNVFWLWESPNMFQHNVERPMIKYTECRLG